MKTMFTYLFLISVFFIFNGCASGPNAVWDIKENVEIKSIGCIIYGPNYVSGDPKNDIQCLCFDKLESYGYKGSSLKEIKKALKDLNIPIDDLSQDTKRKMWKKPLIKLGNQLDIEALLVITLTGKSLDCSLVGKVISLNFPDKVLMNTLSPYFYTGNRWTLPCCFWDAAIDKFLFNFPHADIKIDLDNL